MNKINLSAADYFCLGIYLLLLFFFAYRAYRKTRSTDQEDYLLANRSLTMPAFVATLVTTWYGGILGIGEFSYLYGISTWIVLGLPYYIFAALFAFFLAGRIRRANNITIGDLFYSTYGKPAGLLASAMLLFMTTPAPYILMLSILLQLLFGLPFWISLLLGAGISITYVYFGGFRSVVQTDKLQFILIYGGFAILFYFLISEWGGWQFLSSNLENIKLTWHGGNTFQYVIVWFFIASWTFIDPGFHQRCAAAASASTARKGILVSIVFWFIFDILTVSTGLYASVILDGINPTHAYPLLAEKVLPPFLKGLFLAGLLAVIMSTIDSFSLLSAMTLGRDILWRLKQKNGISVASMVRFSLIFTALLAIILVILIPSVIKLWYVIGSLFIPPMLLPLITAYYPRFRLRGMPTLAAMVISFFVSLIFFILGRLQAIDFLLTIEPFFPGLIMSFCIYILFNLRKGKSI